MIYRMLNFSTSFKCDEALKIKMSKLLFKNDVNVMSALQKVYCLVGFLSHFDRLLISGSRVRVPEGVPKKHKHLMLVFLVV